MKSRDFRDSLMEMSSHEGEEIAAHQLSHEPSSDHLLLTRVSAMTGRTIRSANINLRPRD